MEQRVRSTVVAPIVYPERDGKPMGETEAHIDALIYLREALKDHLRNEPQIYVGADMLLYYEEGNPGACVVPDVFVAKGVPKHERRTYKLWEEAVGPAVVIEITSRATRLEDLGTKRALYGMLGVAEYYLYDPIGEYLQPPLQGYQLVEEEYVRMETAGTASLTSDELGVELRLEDGQIRLIDRATGERLLTPAESHAARRVAEERSAAVEAELERMRAEIKRLRKGGS